MKNDDFKKIGFDLSLLTKVFQLEVTKQTPALETWLNGTYPLTDIQTQLLNSLYEEVKEDGGYWNESDRRSGGAKNSICWPHLPYCRCVCS